jgi:hypothetical protein
MGHIADMDYFFGWKPIHPIKQRRLVAEASASPRNHAKAIGWLTPGVEYTKGAQPSPLWMKKLALLTLQSFHDNYMGRASTINGGPTASLTTEMSEGFKTNWSKRQANEIEGVRHLIKQDGRVRQRSLGSGEFVVVDPQPNNGKEGSQVYVCPSSLYHYIADGSYRPPDEFIDALDKFVPDVEVENFQYRYLSSKVQETSPDLD